MMNITINIQAPELAHALETLAIAIGCTVDKIGVGQAIQEAVKQMPTTKATQIMNKLPEKVNQILDSNDVQELFEEDTYFYHAESDAYFMMKKGEVIPKDADFQLSVEIAKDMYEKGIAKKQEEPKYSLEEVRKALGDLAKAKGKDIAKGILTQFNVSKVTDLDKTQYNDAMKAIKEA